MSAAKAIYADRNGHAPEPRTPSLKVVCQTPARHSHQEHWPEVEVSSRVTIVTEQTWGTDSVTYEIVARRVVDIRDGYTAKALDRARETATQACHVMAEQIRSDNPHPRA